MDLMKKIGNNLKAIVWTLLTLIGMVVLYFVISIVKIVIVLLLVLSMGFGIYKVISWYKNRKS
jgi:hypothetical protein